MTPAGSITFLPKIHGPVSTTMKLCEVSYVASSILPIPPSAGLDAEPGQVYPRPTSAPRVPASRYVQTSVVVCVVLSM